MTAAALLRSDLAAPAPLDFTSFLRAMGLFKPVAMASLAVLTTCPIYGKVTDLAAPTRSAFERLTAPVKAFSAALGGTPRVGNYIPGIQGVGNGAVATVNAPVDRRYHSVRILTTNAAGALTDPTLIVSLVELVVNGVTIRQGAPATFINIAKTYRYTPGTGEIPIFFTEFWRNESPRAAEVTSWDMFGQATFVIKLTFLTPGSGGVGIQNILADFDLQRNTRTVDVRSAAEIAAGAAPMYKRQNFLAIIKQTDTAQNANSGTNDQTTLPLAWPIQRIFMDVSANAISSLQVFIDNNVKQWEFTKAENADILNANDITASFFEYPLIFDYDDKVLDSNLRTSYLDIKYITTGACTVTFHLHQLVNGYR
jgi:hypothetical protein